MKPSKLRVKCLLTALLLTLTNTALAQCGFPSFDAICQYFLGSGTDPYCPGTFSTAACEGKDCMGKNFGNEIMLVPGGDYATIWIARTEGEFFIPWFAGWPCDVSTNRGVSIVELPYGEEHYGCIAGLLTDDHIYAEFFTNNPVTECFGWVECSCD